MISAIRLEIRKWNPANEKLISTFDPTSLCYSVIENGNAAIVTDFRQDGDGLTRILMLDRGMSAYINVDRDTAARFGITAATVNGQDISVSAVTKLAKSKYIVDTASAGGLVSSKDVVVGSTTRRAALGLLVQSEVYEAGIAARKGEITDVDRDAAEAQISDYESNNQTTIVGR